MLNLRFVLELARCFDLEPWELLDCISEKRENLMMKLGQDIAFLYSISRHQVAQASLNNVRLLPLNGGAMLCLVRTERERDTHTRMTSAGGKTNSASSYFPRRNPVTPHTRLEAHTHTKETTKSSCMRFQQKNTSENRIELLFSFFFVSGGFFFLRPFIFLEKN